ncbi:MAG: S16 family serine protease [Ilumatobacteraceae bacterium]
MNISAAVTQPNTVPGAAKAHWAAPRLPDPKHRRWAVPLAVLGLLLAGAFLAASVVLIDRYAEAPGAASAVGPRMSFDAVPRYEPDGALLFVTLSGPHLTALQAFAGWLDPDVDELTFEERYGTVTPDQDRAINLQMMRSAKDDAPYVALTKLGYPTELVAGRVIVQSVLCLEADESGTKCVEYVPADSFLDPGDEIVSVNGRNIEVREDLSAALEGLVPGDRAEFVVRRVTAKDEDDTVTGSVELIANPDDPARAFIGIQLADTSQVKLPFDVSIDTGAIGGPSAGLAFTLAILDELTPGDLTGGAKVAVTGTIDVRGNVGPIGGLRQKSVAVEQSGAELFIVPASQSDADLAAARKVLGEDRVVTVSTLDEALAVLAGLGGNALELGTPGADWAG